MVALSPSSTLSSAVEGRLCLGDVIPGVCSGERDRVLDAPIGAIAVPWPPLCPVRLSRPVTASSVSSPAEVKSRRCSSCVRGTTVLTSSMLFVWVGVSGALVVDWFTSVSASSSAFFRVGGMSRLASWSLRCRCASRCFLRFSRCCLRISGGTCRLSFCTVYGYHLSIL